MDRRFVIDCDTCVRQNTPTCEDCLVTHICGREPGEAVVLDMGEWRSMRRLSEAGLVPDLRHRPREPGTGSGDRVAVRSRGPRGGSSAAV